MCGGKGVNLGQSMFFFFWTFLWYVLFVCASIEEQQFSQETIREAKIIYVFFWSILVMFILLDLLVYLVYVWELNRLGLEQKNLVICVFLWLIKLKTTKSNQFVCSLVGQVQNDKA